MATTEGTPNFDEIALAFTQNEEKLLAIAMKNLAFYKYSEEITEKN